MENCVYVLLEKKFYFSFAYNGNHFFLIFKKNLLIYGTRLRKTCKRTRQVYLILTALGVIALCL